MIDLRTAAQQALEALEGGADSWQLVGPAIDALRAALAEPVLQTCNCRWDGEMQMQQCTLHEAHVDAIKEWAQRAKFAEKKLAALAEPVLAPAPGYCKHCKQYTIEEPLPAEPVEEPKPEPGEYHGWVLREVLFDNGEPVGHREPVQEPVAWKDKIYESLYHQNVGDSIPLYTALPQRKPLTEEEISNIWDGHIVPIFGKNGINPIVFARAIERAHGIGEQQ